MCKANAVPAAMLSLWPHHTSSATFSISHCLPPKQELSKKNTVIHCSQRSNWNFYILLKPQQHQLCGPEPVIQRVELPREVLEKEKVSAMQSSGPRGLREEQKIARPGSKGTTDKEEISNNLPSPTGPGGRAPPHTHQRVPRSHT